jgi:hypothetical protein
MSTKATKKIDGSRQAAKPAKVNRTSGKKATPPPAPAKPPKKPQAAKPKAPKAPAAPKATKAPAAPGTFARPHKDGPCAQLWSIFDKLQGKKKEGDFIQIADAKEAAEAAGLELGTCTVQFYKWRRTLGVRGRGSKQKVG